MEAWEVVGSARSHARKVSWLVVSEVYWQVGKYENFQDLGVSSLIFENLYCEPKIVNIIDKPIKDR